MKSVRSAVASFAFSVGPPPTRSLPPVRCRCLTLRIKTGSTRWSKFSNRQAASHFMRPVILSVLLVVSASLARAEDITTTESKVFKNSEVIRFEPWCCSRKRSSKLKIQGTKKAPGSKVQIPTFILLPARPGFASFPAHPEAARSHSLEIVFAGANPNLPDATFIT